MLFSDRSIQTMMHGIVLSGGALMALSAAIFAVALLRGVEGALARQTRLLVVLLMLTTALIWLAVISGTYVVFPVYRVPPPPGTIDLAAYPRALLLSRPDTAWLHSFAMEIKEHVPWIAAMLVTAVAFVGRRYGPRLTADPAIRRPALTLLVIALGLVSVVGLLGVFVNKIAPVQ